ncbi:MAG: anti-sigma factor [Sphingomonas phyllosphaerae]|uniref:anti-sigma factor n=1 Tax=Sphingomonas phyllosphaerae TaxID=257003 RepID=UPI002FFAF122
MTPDDRILAAELVVGLLSAEEAARAEDWRAREPDFAAEVEWWEARFAPLLAEYRDVAPPPDLAARIEAMLALPTITPRASRLHWRSLSLGAAGGAIAASLAAWLLIPPAATPPVRTPPVARPVAPAGLMIAQLAWTDPSKASPPVAVVEPASGSLRLSRGVDTPAGNDGELWRIPVGGKPVSLGLLPRGGARVIRIATANVPAAGSTLAISIEPRGGSPTGQPTGPVVAAGVVERL